MSAKPCNILFKRFRKKYHDSAVAEIIGVILIFAIAITLFTTFIVWYVPATGTVNEQNYEVQTQHSFYSLADGLSSSQIAQGQSASYSFPLGIQGVPPFSPSNPTSISFSTGYDNFSAAVSLRATVSYTPAAGGISYYNLTENYSGKGVFKSDVLTQFTTPTYFDLQDGFLIQSQGSSSPALGVGPIPVTLNNTTGQGITLGSTLLNISGQSTTASAVGNTMVTLYYNTVNRTEFTVGESSFINGTAATINQITLDYYYYNITGIYTDQWDYAFYHSFNNSAAVNSHILSVSAWNFTGLPFQASNTAGNFNIRSLNQVSLDSLGLNYQKLSVTSI